MISEISIDNYKSLQNFHLKFRKGLNVLIGPNGAGKSNICEALGLVAWAARGPIADYLLKFGGSPATFLNSCFMDKNSDHSKIIKVSCVGELETENPKNDDETIKLKYEYSFSLSLVDQLEITEEKFRLLKMSKNKRYRIVLTAKRYKKQCEIKIKRQNEIGPLGIDLFDGAKRLVIKTEKKQESFLPILDAISYYCFLVREDLRFSIAWNIDPHVAKKASEILDSNEMSPDGRRLSNAIYAMSQHKVKSQDKLSQINELLSGILPGFVKIENGTSSDGQRTFSIVDQKGIECPAHCLSDGTIKAIALLVGIIGRRHNTSIIEEPENYLHPWACQLLIEFFRDFFTKGVCILTTHSETILNTVSPQEIIIVENKEGITESKRITQKRELVAAIRNSGFGCGYHYVSGSLGGTPE